MACCKMCFNPSHPIITSLLRHTFRNDTHLFKIMKRLQSTDAEVATITINDDLAFKFTQEKPNVSKYKVKCNVTPSMVWKDFFKSNSSMNDLNNEQVENTTLEQLDNHLSSNLGHNNKYISTLVLKCMDSNQIFPYQIVIKLLSYYSSKANVNMVNKLEKYCKSDNINFNYYLGLAHWLKGNIDEAFINFNKIFESKNKAKLKTRRLLNKLIMEAVDNSSEASIVLIRKNVLFLLERHNEKYPLASFWRSCILSEWFRDNQIAINLYKEYKLLRDFLDDMVLFVANQAVKEHKEDVIINILQLLIKYDKKFQYSIIVSVLFNYRYKNNDIRGCSEIIRNCSLLNIHLSDIHYNKYLEMQKDTNDFNLQYILNNIGKSSDGFKLKF